MFQKTCIDHLRKYKLCPVELPNLKLKCIDLYDVSESELITYIRNKIPFKIVGDHLGFADWMYIRDICASEHVQNISYTLPNTKRVPDIIVYSIHAIQNQLNLYGSGYMIWYAPTNKIPGNHLIIHTMDLLNPYIQG